MSAWNRSAWNRLGSALCVLALAALSVVGIAAPVQAAPFVPLGPPDGAGGFAATPLITLDPTTVPSGSTVDLTISACIPPGPVAGDSFVMSLPPQITSWPDSFDITAPDGAVWLNVVVDQSVSPALMTFTLTPAGAADDNGTVCFDALLGVTATSAETQTYELGFSISGIELLPKPVLTIEGGGGGCEPNCGPTPVSKPEAPFKGGYFNRADECRKNATDCLTWSFTTPYADLPANLKAYTFTDPAQPGWLYNCAAVSVSLVTSPDFTDSSLTTTQTLTLADAIAAGYVKNWDCSASNLVVTLDNTALPNPAQQLLSLTVAASAKTPGGSGAIAYKNSTEIKAEGYSSSSSTSFSSKYFGSSARGDGIKMIKRDQDGFDANTKSKSVTLTPPDGQTAASTKLVYAVRNIGTTSLRDLTLSDSVVTGGATVSNFTCTFPDGSTGTTWPGPFASKAQFECTADLAGVVGAHKNVAKVTATGRNGSLTRTDPYHAVTPGTVIPAPVSVGDYVWFDTNRDGDQDPGEQPVADVPVFLLDATGAVVGETTTDANGFYSFIDLDPGAAYSVRFEAPEGTTFTRQDAGGPDDADSDADPATGDAPLTSPATGTNSETAPDDPTVDAGLIKYNLTLAKSLASAGPFVGGQLVEFTLTPHNDGPVDSLAGWSVTDLLPDGLSLVSMSGPAPYSCTDNVCVSDAVLAAGADAPPITVVARIDQGAPGSLKNVAYVSPAGADVPESNPLEVPTSATDTVGSATDNDAEAAVTIQPVSIGDFVWWDENRNGRQDPGEAAVGNLTVRLIAPDGTVRETTTNAEGFYSFTDLSPRTAYTVEFVKPGDAVFTEPDAAGSDGGDSDAALATGRVEIVTPDGGSNSASSPDDPTVDAGLMRYNLTLAKTRVSPGPFANGQQVTFTLTPRNDGQVAALAGWSVTDVLPVGLELVSMSGDGYTCAANVCVADAPLAPDANGPLISLVAAIASADIGSLKNVAYISPAGDDIDETNPLAVPTIATDTTATDTDNDAQSTLALLPISIGDFVWWDVDRDGIQDAGEAPIGGVSVRLLDANGDEVATTTTDALGYYYFESLEPGTDYTVVFAKPAGASFTTPNAGADDLDSDADPATGEIAVTTPAGGANDTPDEDDPTIDAGFVKYNLALAKSLDTAGPYSALQEVTFTLTPHNDGPVDALPGWSVTDLLPAGLELVSMSGTGYTCAAGVCTADAALAAGEDGAPVTVVAKIVASQPGRLRNVAYVSPAGDDSEETNPLGSAPGLDTDTSATPTDNDDQTSLSLPPVSLGDYVWYDVNRDGMQSDDEPPVPGVTVKLIDANGDEVARTVTNSAGFYSFTDLLPGADYTVVFVAPDGTSFTLRTVGPERGADSNADPATGEAPTTTPTAGANAVASPDAPTVDAGLVKYNLVLGKTLDTAGPYYQGQTVEFTLVPANRGPVDALPGWSVTDLLPTGLSLTSMSGPGYDCVDAVCVADSPLAAGESGPPITVLAAIAKDFTGGAKNVAYVASSEDDLAETNPLGELPTVDSDPASTATDNDAQAVLSVVPPVRVGNYVWIDFNRDGLQDSSDVPVEGATLTLTRADGAPAVDIYGNSVAPITTDASGRYLFEELPVGQYVVTIDPSTAPALAGYVPTVTGAGAGDVDSSSGSATSTDLLPGEEDLTLDFGFVFPKVRVGNRVWLDADHDGRQDPRERPLEGVKLTLTGPDGEPVTDVFGQPVGPVFTDAEGRYEFANLPALPAGQRYTVTLDPASVPAGLLPTYPNRDDAAGDSSTGSADSGELTADGAEDMTLDFGFWAPAPAIQIVKKDGAGNDANTKKSAVETTERRIKLVYTVTNVGNEPLTDIEVQDELVTEGKVTGLACRFPDRSSGTTWAGPFEIGDEFTCTAKLTAPLGNHKDVGSVTGAGAAFGDSVADDDPYHALITDPDAGDGDQPRSDQLPQTGSPVRWWHPLGVAGLLAVGSGLILAARRRRGATEV
ncbi:MAG: SdrD B-like domain-containing protein [Nocardioides sp.]